MPRKFEIAEGEVFLVPLTTTGFGVGVLIRGDGKGRAYGAFFGPRVTDATEVDIVRLRDDDAIMRCRFGDYGLRNELWPRIGSIPDWSLNRWKLPLFTRNHDNPELCFVTTYDERLNAIAERLQPVAETLHLPHDSQLGSGIVEIRLEELLGSH